MNVILRIKMISDILTVLGALTFGIVCVVSSKYTISMFTKFVAITGIVYVFVVVWSFLLDSSLKIVNAILKLLKKNTTYSIFRMSVFDFFPVTVLLAGCLQILFSKEIVSLLLVQVVIVLFDVCLIGLSLWFSYKRFKMWFTFDAMHDVIISDQLFFLFMANFVVLGEWFCYVNKL